MVDARGMTMTTIVENDQFWLKRGQRSSFICEQTVKQVKTSKWCAVIHVHPELLSTKLLVMA